MAQLYHEVASGVDPILFVVDSDELGARTFAFPLAYVNVDLGLDTVIYPDVD